MPREGRALELLVERLEVVASSGSASVRSPEYVVGRNSGSRREIDVAVRSRVGSSEVLVMFECRDRAEVADVRWIEEIASKRKDVGANLAVAVSTSGFTTGAKNAAEGLHVQLRVIEEVTVADVISWCRLKELTVQRMETRAPFFELNSYADMPDMNSRSPYHQVGLDAIPIDLPMFALWDASGGPPPRDPNWQTARQLCSLALDLMRQVDGFDPSAFADWRQVKITMSDQRAPTVAVSTVRGLFPLAQFAITIQVRCLIDRVPVILRQVTAEDGSTTQIAEAVAVAGGEKCTVSFVNSSDGISIMMETEVLE